METVSHLYTICEESLAAEFLAPQEVEMKCCFLFLLETALLGASLPSFAGAQTETPAQQQTNPDKKPSALKLIKSPPAAFPEEAVRKNIEGKVVLSIVVDANGEVTDATVLSGPPELFQAAIDNVKQWEFEPPVRAPVATKAEVTFGYNKECPAPVSDFGEVIASNRVTNERGMVLDIVDAADWRLPYYPTEDRKAGVAGEMVLSVRVNEKGKVVRIRVVKSLSPDLDKTAEHTVRSWRFKVRSPGAGSLPADFPLHILFRGTCAPEF